MSLKLILLQHGDKSPNIVWIVINYKDLWEIYFFVSLVNIISKWYETRVRIFYDLNLLILRLLAAAIFLFYLRLYLH